jgi:hypothetical protein
MNKLTLASLLLIAAVPVMAQQSDANNPFSSDPPAPSSDQGAPRVQRQTRAAASGYSTLQAAQQACGSDPVVWGNTRSHAYHTSTDKLFGKTRRGTYLCQAAAQQGGYHAVGKASHRRYLASLLTRLQSPLLGMWLAPGQM